MRTPTGATLLHAAAQEGQLEARMFQWAVLGRDLIAREHRGMTANSLVDSCFALLALQPTTAIDFRRALRS